MAKKASKEAEEAPVAAASVMPTDGPTVQSTEEEPVKLPCAREYFYNYCRRAWGYCQQHLTLFFDESDRFTEEFIEAQIELIDAAELLPSNEVRVSEATAARELLLPYAQQVRSKAKRLTKIIGYAYKDPTVAATQRTMAGLTAFSDITDTDWSGYETFINKADTYLTANAASLVAAQAMKAGFPTAFSTLGTTFKLARKTFNDKENLAKIGTKTLNDALKEILVELNPMLDLGKEIFEFDATNRKLFTVKDLVNEVRGTHPAGLEGYVRNDLGKGIEGVLVAVADQPEKFAITDKKGKYKINLAGGAATFNFSMEGMEPQSVTRTLTAGVTSRQNVVLVPVVIVELVASEPAAPPAEEAPATSEKIVEAPTSDHALSSALSKMTAKPPSTNGVGA